MDVVAVTDPADPRLEPYRSVRDRDLARLDAFMAEGETVVETLLGSPLHRPDSLLLSERQAARLLPRWRDRLQVPAYVAPQAVLDAVVGFHLHRGVLACGRRAPAAEPEALVGAPGEPSTILLLAGLSNHDNVGAAFRNAAAFGAAAVLLDPACCDPLYRKAIRVSVGAALLTPFARVASAEAGARLLAETGYDLLALSPDGRERLDQLRPSPRTALLLGAEGPGLSIDLRRRLRTVKVAMAPGLDSLNVAAAAAIALHHLWTARAPD